MRTPALTGRRRPAKPPVDWRSIPPSPITFSLISIREPIELGERSTGCHVEIKQNGTWNKAPKDSSGNQLKGTVIGQRQLWRLNSTTADAVALVVDSARGVPVIAEFGAY